MVSPLYRCKKRAHITLTEPAPHIGVIVLAAGCSRRMGAVNKLTSDIDGEPMLHRVAEAALASQASPVIVVTGHDRKPVEQVLAGLGVEFVYAPDSDQGMSASLKSGIAALPDAMDGAVICLGDMPYVTAAHIDRLIGCFKPEAGAAICISSHQGKRGNPVLLARAFFHDIMALEGDTGARAIFAKYAAQATDVEMGDTSILKDFDRPEDFTA